MTAGKHVPNCSCPINPLGKRLRVRDECWCPLCHRRRCLSPCPLHRSLQRRRRRWCDFSRVVELGFGSLIDAGEREEFAGAFGLVGEDRRRRALASHVVAVMRRFGGREKGEEEGKKKANSALGCGLSLGRLGRKRRKKKKKGRGREELGRASCASRGRKKERKSTPPALLGRAERREKEEFLLSFF